MPFLAECTFCKGKVRVPNHAEGQSVACPRCGSAFTLAPMKDPPKVSKDNLCRPDASATTFPPIANAAPSTDDASPFTDDSPAANQPAWLAGALSLFLASGAAICLSYPMLRPLTFTLGGVSLVCGLVGALGASSSGRRLTAAAGVVISLCVLVIARYWPYLLTMYPPPQAAPADSGPVDTRPVVAVAIEGGKEETPRGWLDAGKYCLQQGDLRVRVQSAVVRAPFESARPKRPPPMLHIALRLSNVGSGQPIVYRGWVPRDANEAGATLRDNTGRLYKGIPAAPTRSGGLQRATPIEPRGLVEETLLFEAPPETVEFLRLELPAAAVGGAGVLHFEIPRKMIEWRLPRQDAPVDP
jgi:hypothetical protein